MMKKMISLSVILAMTVCILWGCSSSSHLHNSHPQMEKQEEKREEISIVFNEKEVKLPIRQIPPINQFLEQLDPTQREQEMSRFRITTFSSKTGDLYADVGYTRDHSFTTLAKWKQQDKPTKTVKITFDL
ncbi:hypothetical protein [Brevibacillus thermoruber]|nr:hypothetical protein [Brevibacillus thermoruber]